MHPNFDTKVERLKTPEECYAFAENVMQLGYDELALQARKRAVNLKAKAYGATTLVEQECLEAIYAYEVLLSVKNGKTTRANRTWQLIKRNGIIAAVESAVIRPSDASGFKMLQDMGLGDHTFEAVVLKHPDIFSKKAVESASEKLKKYN